ncbi:hypothetical protein G6F35_018377 [Rhizopus arrhizus]|nr:hypothetical protein G6F35_018377 [Rhizopus arrhizus]
MRHTTGCGTLDTDAFFSLSGGAPHPADRRRRRACTDAARIPRTQSLPAHAGSYRRPRPCPAGARRLRPGAA